MASFKTAYLQREIPLHVAVKTTCKVGDYVKYTAAAGDVPAYIEKSTIAAATHIVAQSDMTLEYGHVPVENRDYRYDPTVAFTGATSGANITAATPTKLVALFAITDKSDIIPDADGNDHA